MALFAAGGVITSASLNAIDTIVRKASNLTVNNSTTYVSDTELTVALAASSTWSLELFLLYQSATAAAAKVNMSGPSGWSMSLGNDSLVSSSTGTGASIDRGVVVAGGAGHAMGSAGATTPTHSCPKGFVQIGSTAGSVTVQFAQLTANASNTTLLPGSWMKLTRIS